ncbi:MAG: M48 family metallopeptidase [Sporomusaceae bacterium]|nr:M48 family metallopeptidase [Sporomusaceae bacterium]
MNTIQLANHQLTYHVIYQKKRSTLQLKILSSTHLQITAPSKFPTASVEQILHKKCNWIIKKIQHLAHVAANPINKSITHGASILYLGQPYILAFTNTQCSKPTIYLEDCQIIINSPLITPGQTASLTEALLKQWYWDKASALLSEKTLQWAAKIKVEPQRITIKEQKTRWGSCSSKGNINYNWRIIMAPPDVIDYLVIHELCHLRVPNHSAAFWQEVGHSSPFFKQHRTWLKNNSRILMGIL